MSVVCNFVVCHQLSVRSVNLDVLGKLLLQFTGEVAVLHRATVFRDDLVEITKVTLQIILPDAGELVIHFFA